MVLTYTRWYGIYRRDVWWQAGALRVFDQSMTDELPEDETAADGPDTRKALLERARWKATPISNRFVQLPPVKTGGPRAGQLAQFVKNGDKRGLLTYAFLLSIMSNGDGAVSYTHL